MAGSGNRPISPHLQIWRWGPAMLVSILHRVSGNGLAFAGLAVLVWWLAALAGGEASYDAFVGHATAWYGRVVLVGLTWAFFNHLVSGVRHLVLDIGAGYELERNAFWSVLTPIAGVVLTVAFWAIVLLA
ncbi:MAG TPA: succinate dehydrogenase, cytochrome b556 subunit [Novosphingobium sp.]|jgi:succinate dehydrogenase / fumarate reductase cytochrome b subunit|nr:succinate dehydrogenase, cytochrome b556 subunit [Novosphingobium sp.]HOA48052.1 succinate dehydrogenase, cytochrome b556 subunit [Novosphingobium sp.]HPB23344.1 succinate dehydrogenase, cytochrome b556 subunit [Novosphingobium sp.]HPZ46955.1 succinate dehydrogenase, cytochrome b556 subunit [Novosphingobium sp.]HQD98205.1 succinate dehydrogenase, cytochrome b556 subunit [Novosphingobium sp.]